MPNYSDAIMAAADLTQLEPYGVRLQRELDAAHKSLVTVLDRSRIRRIPTDPDFIVITPHTFEWVESDAPTTSDRMKLLEHWGGLCQRLRLLFPTPTPEVRRTLSSAMDGIRDIVERPTDGARRIVPATVDEVRDQVSDWFNDLTELVRLATEHTDGGLLVVPDTNSLLRNWDLVSYARALGTDRYCVYLVPTVQKEIDDLKDRGRTEETRGKAQKVTRVLGGLRERGSLLNGVKLAGNSMVRADPKEPDPAAVLDWLDGTVPDDRTLASALGLQSRSPASSVVLITSDGGLKTKAEFAGLPYIETPPTDEQLAANLEPELTSHPKHDNWIVTLTNQGPQKAKDVVYCVRSPPSTPGPRSTAGPWTTESIPKGQADTNGVFGFVPSTVEVHASWTDGRGPQERTWERELPAKRPRRGGIASAAGRQLPNAAWRF